MFAICSFVANWPQICSFSRTHFPVLSSFMTYHRLTRWMTLVEQEQLTLPEHLSSLWVFSGIRITRSFVLCVCFVDRCLSFCTFSFGHCVVCSFSIYVLWWPHWYLQTLLIGQSTSDVNIACSIQNNIEIGKKILKILVSIS